MPQHELEEALEVFGCELALSFGMTEMSPETALHLPEHQLSHAGAVGRAAIGVQIGIMDEEGNLLGPGEVGEIVYRGPQTMNGYLKDEEATAAAFRHGWFHSGDLGRFDEDSVLYFVDRLKDVIKTGGEWVSSIEVEGLIAEVPGVHECAVIGVRDERWGERPMAFVVRKPGMGLQSATICEQLLQQVALNRISKYAVPEPDRIAFISEIPKTSVGKINKKALRDLAA